MFVNCSCSDLFVAHSPANDCYQSPRLPKVEIQVVAFWRDVSGCWPAEAEWCTQLATVQDHYSPFFLLAPSCWQKFCRENKSTLTRLGRVPYSRGPRRTSRKATSRVLQRHEASRRGTKQILFDHLATVSQRFGGKRITAFQENIRSTWDGSLALADC
jgi:hypothetical protein